MNEVPILTSVRSSEYSERIAAAMPGRVLLRRGLYRAAALQLAPNIRSWRLGTETFVGEAGEEIASMARTYLLTTRTYTLVRTGMCAR